MKWKVIKLKASALHFAILIAVIVALLLSSFLLLTYTFSSFSIKSDQVLENIKQSNLGIEYLFKPEIKVSDSLEIQLNQVPVILKSSYWGSFEKVSSKAGIGSSAFEKIALLGSISGVERTSIYVEDHQLPLVVVGNTRIEGTAYIPENNIKHGNISGNYYQGNSLIYGNRSYSSIALPELEPEWKLYAKEMLDFVPSSNEDVVGLDNISNSFFNNRKVIFHSERIFLEQEIKGYVIIKSEIEIEVSQFAKLDQVLLIAPKVVFNKEFKGNAHVIANEVIVQENVELKYPSSIVVIGKDSTKEEDGFVSKPKIEIRNSAVFQGNIIYLDSYKDSKSKIDVHIEEDALIEGTIYCEGYTELSGTVVGSVLTSYFVANQEGSIYINHIYNGQVLTNISNPEICGVPFENQFSKIASWLY